MPLILDADALNCLAKIAIDGIDSNPEMYRREQPLVMTPHYRELSRLVAGDEVNDLGTAIAAAQKVVWAAGSDNLWSLPRGRRRLSVALSVCCCRSRVRLLWQLPVRVMFSRVFLAGTLATMRGRDGSLGVAVFVRRRTSQLRRFCRGDGVW